MELTGTWRAAVADDDLRRTWQEDDFDDDALGDRSRFPVTGDRRRPSLTATDRSSSDARSTLAATGGWSPRVADASTGSSTKATCGSTVPTSATRRATSPRTPSRSPTRCEHASEHHLAVEVTCTPPSDLTAKRSITGVFQHWDCLDPDWNPGGLWRPVRVTETGPVRIARLRALCREATPERAVLVLRATLDSDAARTVCLAHHARRARPRERPAARGRCQRRGVDPHRRPTRPLVAAGAR